MKNFKKTINTADGNYIYKFLDKDGVVLYVGRTINLYTRFVSHFSEDNMYKELWKNNIVSIEYLSLNYYGDMIILETYFIHKYKAICNKLGADELYTSIDLKDNFIWRKVENIEPLFKHKITDIDKYVDDLNQVLKGEGVKFISNSKQLIKSIDAYNNYKLYNKETI